MLLGMPNVAHPLFSAPVDRVDPDMVRNFLALELEESFTLDYKRNIDGASDTVAAMANTYGGIVLIGVDAHPKDKNLPGGLVGVKVIDKDRLVSKMATTFDPPGWTPDVIPVTLGDKILLVVRVVPDSVPQPLFHQGVVRVRLDGRNIPADRRLVHALFQQADDPVFSCTADPRFAPAMQRSSYQTYGVRPAPDLVVRAATSRLLRMDGARFRLHGTTVDALMMSLSEKGHVSSYKLPERLRSLLRRVDSQQQQRPWTIDPSRGHGRFVRLMAGHDAIDKNGQARLKVQCTAILANGGSSLDVFFDLLFWTGSQPVANDLWIQACYEAVRALVFDAFPPLTRELLGSGAIPTPPVELHIVSDTEQEVLSLDERINTDLLGKRTGGGILRRGSEYLPEDLLANADLPAAVLEALRNIALDWRFLHPNFPDLRE